MTSNARPNLGGLFNGSTPPQQPSRIGDPASPRLVTSVPISETPLPPRGSASPGPTRPSAAKSGSAASGSATSGPARSVPPQSKSDPGGRQQAQPEVHWADPVGLVNQYFGLLRTLLDLNQQWAVACATAVAALPRRVGLHR